MAGQVERLDRSVGGLGRMNCQVAANVCGHPRARANGPGKDELVPPGNREFGPVSSESDNADGPVRTIDAAREHASVEQIGQASHFTKRARADTDKL